MAEKVLAAVRTGPSTTEVREYPMPDIPEDAALMKMEVGGICGTDVKLYKHPPSKAPVIMGHENIGVIAKAGREFTQRKGFKEGDLVFVEHYVSCGKCEWCHAGQYRHCENTNWRTNPDAIRYGYTSSEKAPHLWGGFAQYVYLPWNAVLHHVPKGVSAELAGLVTPMANGVEWSLFDGGVGYNSTVLIQGPGQQGLSQTVVCKQAGAAQIIVTGTTKDKARIEVAKRLGADHVIDVQKEDPLERLDGEQHRNRSGTGGAVERDVDALAAGDFHDALQRVFLLHVDDVVGAELFGDVHTRFVLGRAGDDDQRGAGLLADHGLRQALLARALDQHRGVIADAAVEQRPLDAVRHRRHQAGELGRDALGHMMKHGVPWQIDILGKAAPQMRRLRG